MDGTDFSKLLHWSTIECEKGIARDSISQTQWCKEEWHDVVSKAAITSHKTIMVCQLQAFISVLAMAHIDANGR